MRSRNYKSGNPHQMLIEYLQTICQVPLCKSSFILCTVLYSTYIPTYQGRNQEFIVGGRPLCQNSPIQNLQKHF